VSEEEEESAKRGTGTSHVPPPRRRASRPSSGATADSRRRVAATLRRRVVDHSSLSSGRCGWAWSYSPLRGHRATTAAVAAQALCRTRSPGRVSE
jgi:hypothetical protein